MNKIKFLFYSIISLFVNMSKPIYYLVSVDNNSESEEYIMAISFDKHILEDMIINNYEPNEDYKLIIRENLKIF